MSSANRTAWAVSLVVVMGFGLLLCSGCGGGVEYEGDERAAVSGTVTLDGNPLPFGTITLVPVGQGRRASGVIDEGNYSIPEEQGPNLGEYKVEILGFPKPAEGEGEDEEEEGGDDDEEGGGALEDNTMVGSEYNTETTLTATIVSGENTHNFEVSGE